ncbi:MAG: glutathione S-transferase [Rhodobacteraceae bacterium]|jgi:glutathione S-transferase|nr:glutathione S-transferase [Paracoccaceae bacterium]
MSEIDLAYLPVIGRGEQINIICAMHGIKVNSLMSNPMGEDFNKDTQAPFGTIPWMKDHSNGIELNDSMAIVQYLVTKYEGPLTPQNPEEAAIMGMYWAWCQDYYSFVLSPFHDIITGHNEPFWRNLRLTDTLAEGGKETGIKNLTTLHKSRANLLERHLEKSGNVDQFLTGSKCSYADIFLFTCVRTTQETGGFGILRDELGRDPFEDYPIITQICNEVGKIDVVSKTVGSKFSECPI